MKLVVAEKPSVAQSLAAVLGAKEKKDGYLEGGGWLVSWCVGHLVELAQPEAYGAVSYTHLLTLSTCTNGGADRFIVMGRLVAVTE